MSQQAARVVLIDRDGLRGSFDAASPALYSGNGQVLVILENGQQALVPVNTLIRQNDGSFVLPFSLSEFARGQAPHGASGSAQQASGQSEDETLVVPVIAEKLEVQKRKVESGGVRVRKIVREHEEVVDEPLIREEVQVKHVPINRIVDGPIPVRHVGNTMIISLLEEVLVVETRLMLKEELHITKSEVETYKPQRVLLRSEEATVERVDAQGQQVNADNNIQSPS